MTDYRKLIDDLWGYAETGFEEYHSAETMCTFLEKEGFQVTRNIAHMETAFEAVYGTGKPVICFLGEYDAPENQMQDLVKYNYLKDGNTIIYGNDGSENEMMLNTIILTLTNIYK